MNRLNNKVAVFIGGGSSVGSVACKTFLEEGANVVLVDIDEKYFERTAELRNQYGEDRVVTFIGACTEQADMDEAIRFAVNHFGGVDILLNLAGFHGAGWVDAILPEQWDRAMDVTCTGAYRACPGCNALYERAARRTYYQLHFIGRTGKPDGGDLLCQLKGRMYRPDQGSGYGVGTLWNQCDCICPWNAEYKAV